MTQPVLFSEAVKVRKGLTPAIRADVLAGGEGYYCGWPATEVGHIIPRSRGGGHEDENLVPACSRCNLQKRAQTPGEWAAGRLAAGKPWPIPSLAGRICDLYGTYSPALSSVSPDSGPPLLLQANRFQLVL
ncbi:MAG: HNH endonuclease signature motif containing protein [Mycobacterium sp.]|uniref:HNH endonuclease n=1 Tax=Mycobacterium sp. TaxID=1785 RepID=UPI003C398081